MLSLFLQFCGWTFVSSSFHPVLVPFREFLFTYGLPVHNNTSRNLCAASYLPQSPPISSTPVVSRLFPSPSNVCPLAPIRIILVLFFAFLRVTPHHCTPIRLHTHTHTHTTIYTPSTSLPRTHAFHSSPHPYLLRARTSAPIHVILCLLSASLRAPVYHSTHYLSIYYHPHPSTPPFGVCVTLRPPPCILSDLIVHTSCVDLE